VTGLRPKKARVYSPAPSPSSGVGGIVRRPGGRNRMRARIVAFAALFVSFAAAAQEASPGPVGSETGPDREQLHWVPYPAPPAQRQALLFMRVCRPPGAGPHKMAVINHGSPPVADHRPTMEPIGCAHEAARWFLERGFAIAVPMRRGYGRTGGRWMENYGTCAEPDFHRAGLTSANDVQAAVAYARAALRAQGRRGRRGSIGRGLGDGRAIEPQSRRGGADQLRRWPRRAAEQPAQQQLRARQADRNRRPVRRHRSASDAVDLQ